MEVSALKYSSGMGRPSRSPLIRLQSDEHLIKVVRAGHDAGFEVLLGRYEARLLSFCRHLLGSREDAEDVLQEVFSAAYKAIHADDRPINVRPWLYRIARNRCLNHMRRTQAIGVDSMDVLLAANGESTADKVHQREEFRLLVHDIHGLPESQRTALILRELDALSYEQIAEAMETTVSSVKSLLVRARISLAEASEARLLSCAEVRTELGEVAEGLINRPTPLVRRHLKGCERCTAFNQQLKKTNRALAGLMPLGPFVIWKSGLLAHLPGQAGGGAAAAGSSAAGTSSGVTGGALAGGVASSSGFLGAGAGALATKTAAGLAVAAVLAAVGVSSSTNSAPATPRYDRSSVALSGGSHTSRSVHATAPRPTATGALSPHAGAPTRPHTAATTDQPLRRTGATRATHHLTSLSAPAVTPRAPASGATQTTAASAGGAVSGSTGTSTGATSSGNPLLGSNPGTSGASGSALASAAATIQTLANALGAGLRGSGTSGSTQHGSSDTITLPVLTPPASSRSGSSGYVPSPTDPGSGTGTTPALSTPAA